MRAPITPAEFDALFIARVKALRKLTGKDQKEMAVALDVSHDRYRKYETRTPLPLELLERFAAIVGVPVDFLITGRRIAGRDYPNVPGPHHLDRLRSGVPIDNLTDE